MQTRLALGILVPALVLLTNCSASFPTQPTTPAPVVEIRVQYSTSLCTRLMVGGQPSLEAYAVDADGVYRTVTNQVSWTSSNPSVVLPVTSSLIFLAGPGTADLRANYQGLVGTLTLSVASLTFPYLDVALSGFPRTARAQIRPGPALNDVGADVTLAATWTSSDPSVATLDGPRVTTGFPGNVEIRASYNGLSGSCWIAVPPRS